MSTTLSTKVNLAVSATLADGFGNWPFPILDLTQVLTTGTSSGMADMAYAAQRTIASSGSPDTLDLYGTLKMPNGDTLNLVSIALICIQNTDTSNSLIIGAGSNCLSTLFSDTSDKLIIKPGGFAIIGATSTSAYGVTSSTADILQVACSGGTNVKYNVLIVGRSA